MNETKEALKARIAELERLALAVEQTADGVAIADLEGNLQFANQAWAAMHGYSGDEILGQSLAMFHTEEQLKNEVLPFNEKAMEKGQHEGEVGHMHRDGTIFPTHMTTTVIKDEDGKPIGIVGTARDITKRKQAEQALVKAHAETQRQQSLLDSILDNMPIGVMAVDNQFQILRTNEVAGRMLGREIIDREGNAYVEQYDVINTDTGERYEETDLPLVKTITQGGRHMADNIAVRRPDGTLSPQIVNAGPLLDPSGEQMGGVVIFADITAQKQAEAERERLQQQVLDVQQQVIAELSTPIIPIMERIIVMPLVGAIDSMRARDTTRALLAGISEYRAKVVILDITGVPVVDSGVAGHLDKTIQAARLKGARTIITGISDAVAEAIVDLGIDWSKIDTMRDLQTGLIAALGSMGIKLSK